jgi:hypothetical protein
VAYLKRMAERHPARVSAHLQAAADGYQQAMTLLASADYGKETLHTDPGREKLASLVDELAALEVGAVESLEKACGAGEQQR